MKLKNMKLKNIKLRKGVFTVEAAVIVPMVTFMTAVLIGFIY